MTKELLAAAIARKSLSNTYQYAGGTISILFSAADTGGTFSAWETVQRPGGEPPLHVHRTYDETFFVLEGEMHIMVGDEIIRASAGDMVFAPRGVPHTFRIKSSQVHAVTFCTPGGFEEWFRTLGRPATRLELPDHLYQPTEAEVRQMIALGRKLETDIIGNVEF
jgi:mannose-6-phosphate isomerase-like protein (cupin superfamily)